MPTSAAGQDTGDSPGWGLFADWCAATGNPALPTTWPVVADFLAEVPCSPVVAARRLRAIRTAHQQLSDPTLDGVEVGEGPRLPGALPRPTVPQTAWRTGLVPGDPGGRRWLTLGQALAALPVHGYPTGVRARRDGLVLVAAGLLGLPRARVAALATTRLVLSAQVALDGRPVPAADPPEQCPGCALTRWARALSAWQHEWAEQAWYALEEELWKPPPGPGVHDCARPVPPGWTHARHLVPRIGPRGSLGLRLTPIAGHTITRILAARQHPGAATPRTTADPPGQAPGTPRGHRRPAGPAPDPAQLTDLFDRLDARIAALDAATRALLHAAE